MTSSTRTTTKTVNVRVKTPTGYKNIPMKVTTRVTTYR